MRWWRVGTPPFWDSAGAAIVSEAWEVRCAGEEEVYISIVLESERG